MEEIATTQYLRGAAEAGEAGADSTSRNRSR
jgi:hypothetical protein